MDGKIIVITSGKGGVGKTTATASIGAALAMEGKKVAVVDMDIGLRNLDVVMGLENRIVFNIVDAVKGNLYLIPASQSDNKTALSPEGMVRFSDQLRREFDYILMDCPAGIERGFENSVAAADEAVVICTPEVSSVRDADRVIGLLYARSVTPKLVVNRIIPEMVARGDMLSHYDMVEVLSVELIGLVPMDDHVIVATNTGIPLVLQKDSKAGEAFRRIAMRINGRTDIPIQIPQTNNGFWKKLTQKFGFKK